MRKMEEIKLELELALKEVINEYNKELSEEEIRDVLIDVMPERKNFFTPAEIEEAIVDYNNTVNTIEEIELRVSGLLFVKFFLKHLNKYGLLNHADKLIESKIKEAKGNGLY